MQLEKTTRWGFANGVNQYYGIGAIIAVGVIGGLGYYIYQAKKGQVNREVLNRALQILQGPHSTQAPTPRNPPPQQQRPQTNKFEMD